MVFLILNAFQTQTQILNVKFTQLPNFPSFVLNFHWMEFWNFPKRLLFSFLNKMAMSAKSPNAVYYWLILILIYNYLNSLLINWVSTVLLIIIIYRCIRECNDRVHTCNDNFCSRFICRAMLFTLYGCKAFWIELKIYYIRFVSVELKHSIARTESNLQHLFEIVKMV